ncbi:MAG: hypothetical protein GY940_26450 [bacterium]|nr:hypothetical protein [bacterium]
MSKLRIKLKIKKWLGCCGSENLTGYYRINNGREEPIDERIFEVDEGDKVTMWLERGDKGAVASRLDLGDPALNPGNYEGVAAELKLDDSYRWTFIVNRLPAPYDLLLTKAPTVDVTIGEDDPPNIFEEHKNLPKILGLAGAILAGGFLAYKYFTRGD